MHQGLVRGVEIRPLVHNLATFVKENRNGNQKKR